jgi:hypothetical protein
MKCSPAFAAAPARTAPAKVREIRPFAPANIRPAGEDTPRPTGPGAIPLRSLDHKGRLNRSNACGYAARDLASASSLGSGLPIHRHHKLLPNSMPGWQGKPPKRLAAQPTSYTTCRHAISGARDQSGSIDLKRLVLCRVLEAQRFGGLGRTGISEFGNQVGLFGKSLTCLESLRWLAIQFKYNGTF